MRTTINEHVGRWGGASVVEDFNDLLQKTRELLANTCAFLELRIETLSNEKAGANEPDEVKALDGLITDTRKCLQQAVDVRTKALAAGITDKPELDLEAARDEILGRFARLSDRG